MTKQRLTFTPEFKCEAACLGLNQGYNHAEAAHSLGLVDEVLRRWLISFSRSAATSYRSEKR